MIKQGDLFVQTKEIEGFPYNYVYENWELVSVNEKHYILRHGSVGLGVSPDELKNYFESFNLSVSKDTNDNYDKMKREDEMGYVEDEDEKEGLLGKIKGFFNRR